ncbi:MAG: hypothetical protein ABIO36_08285 [Pyrinomonadaceae bacterium]
MNMNRKYLFASISVIAGKFFPQGKGKKQRTPLLRLTRHRMKSIYLKRSLIIVAVLLLANILTLAQIGSKSLIDEKNVRAEMGFLASDAMQGRGSGTIFERVAAEYIGSQFMQFGLEPAGEMDAAGKQTYVQPVNYTS